VVIPVLFSFCSVVRVLVQMNRCATYKSKTGANFRNLTKSILKYLKIGVLSSYTSEPKHLRPDIELWLETQESVFQPVVSRGVEPKKTA
jgi:hypothetical protein